MTTEKSGVQKQMNWLQQNKRLKEQLKALREVHEYALLELGELRENEVLLRKLNDTLVQNISLKCKVEPLGDIKVILDGEFTNRRIEELEKQLDQYRSGVNSSIDRRVKNIVKEYSLFEEQENKRSRINCHCLKNIHINYHPPTDIHQHPPTHTLVDQSQPLHSNVHPQNDGPFCSRCQELQNVINNQNTIIQDMKEEIDELQADRQVYLLKFNKQESVLISWKKQKNDLIKELEKVNQRLLDQKEYSIRKEQQIQQAQKQFTLKHQKLLRQHDYLLEQLEHEQQNVPSKRQSYGSRPSFSRNNKGNMKENEMIREIGHLVQDLSNRKREYPDYAKTKTSRISTTSRISNAVDYGSLFSIKDGINRPSNQTYY